MKTAILLIITTFLFNISGYSQASGGNSALLVIDMQEEFTMHTMDEDLGDQVIQGVNDAISALRPMKIIFIQANIRVLTISLKGIKAESAEHVDLDQRLDRRQEDLVLMKDESSALTVEELEGFLKENQVDHLYLTGIFLGQCLSNTAIHAVEDGYRVTVISDAVTAKNPKKSGKLLRKLEEHGVQVIAIEALNSATG